MVVAGKLPETGLQVEIPVEAQCAVPPQSTAELIGCRVSHTFRAAQRISDETMTCGDLIVVKQVGAAVISNAGSVKTESQVKVHEGASGDDRKHTCQAKREKSRIAQLALIVSQKIALKKYICQKKR